MARQQTRYWIVRDAAGQHYRMKSGDDRMNGDQASHHVVILIAREFMRAGRRPHDGAAYDVAIGVDGTYWQIYRADWSAVELDRTDPILATALGWPASGAEKTPPAQKTAPAAEPSTTLRARVLTTIQGNGRLWAKCWPYTDAYGPVGYVPSQGLDWSGFRDSSDGAIARMADVLKIR